MGIDCMKARLKENSTSSPSVPPGFSPHRSFTLEKIIDSGPLDSVVPDLVPMQNKMVNQVNFTGEEKFSKCLRQRPWINYSQFDNSSDEESDSDLVEENAPPVTCLPKGVVRGCPECITCQKVTARWRPEEPCRPVLDDAPVFYPTEEEFKDTLKYIASIRPKAEAYGICRIVPPASWNPPCPLKEKHVWGNSKFLTRVQRIDKLQNRCSEKKLSTYNCGLRRKKRRLMKMESDTRNLSAHSLEHHHHAYQNHVERFGFEPGPEFTLESFRSYADQFKEQYFRINENKKDLRCNQSETSCGWEPLVTDIEGEYWRVVEKPTEEIEVLYGADIETGNFGSGFPKMSPTSTSSNSENDYVKSGWNLNNFPRLPGSVLAFESTDISGVLVPWLYVGMCFSSFCWHVEDHHFYSLNYMHWGDPKIWYGVPGSDALKLETTMRKSLPELFEEQPDLLHNLVTQFSPSILKSEGVPVFRCVQNAGEFVLTFPRAYHSGFNCGFNCAEAVNVAPIDWLPHGQLAVELYHEQKRKISVSHDKLLLGAAREAVRAQWEISFLKRNTIDNLRWKDACGHDGILAKALKARIDTEQIRRKYLCSSYQSRKMDVNFDATNERECDICHYDLHLAAAGCSCSSDKFACLEHAKQMCSCAWDLRFFLFRYDISELNMLLDAVGGKLSAVHKWSLKYLGLSLSSYINKDKMQESNHTCKVVEGTKSKEPEPPKQEGFAGMENVPCLSQSVSMHMAPATSPGDTVVKSRCLADLANPTNVISHDFPSVTTIPKCNEGNMKEAVDTELRNEPCAADRLSPGMKLDPTFQVRGHVKTSGSSLEETICHSSRDQSSSDLHQTTKEQKAADTHPALVHVSENKSISNNMVSVPSPEAAIKLEEASLGSQKTKEGPRNKCAENFDRQMHDNDNVSPCDCKSDQVLETPETDASVMNDSDINSDVLMVNVKMSSSQTDIADLGKHGKNRDLSSSFSQPVVSKTYSKDTSDNHNTTNVRVLSNVRQLLTSQQILDCTNLNVGSDFEPSKPHGNIDADGKNGLDSSRKLPVRQSVSSSPSLVHNTVDKYSRQGPRMAKVVRRVNSVVEPLTYGAVIPGLDWSCGQAIFPKGFRSRVKYFSVLNPTEMCYYVSEILDPGLKRPLFVAQVEQYPDEIFAHFSPNKCWDMVRERVNLEIRKQHSLGGMGVPVLQPPGSVDGLEMFGLTSPEVIKVIEAMDVNHISLSYWRSKHQNGGSPIPDGLNRNGGAGVAEEHGRHETQLLPPDAGTIFQGLVKKLNHEELHLLRTLVGNNESIIFKEEASKLLNQQIGSRPPKPC